MMPRSKAYREKTITAEKFIKRNGTRYYRRVFNDNSVELVRFDETAQKWIFLLFKGDDISTNP